MTYRMTGLDPGPFKHLFGLSDEALAQAGVVRMVSHSNVGFPCRITLDDAPKGTSLLLLNHVSHPGGPYHAAHAIFVTETEVDRGEFIDAIPPALDRRILSLRAFDGSGMMVSAALAHPGEADAGIRRLLDDPAVDHIDAHNATRGCFAARIERA